MPRTLAQRKLLWAPSPFNRKYLAALSKVTYLPLRPRSEGKR